MKNLNNSRAKYKLTESIRNLEFLQVSFSKKDRLKKYISDLEYWCQSLDILRDNLYYDDDYSGQISLKDSIHEICSEFLNFYTVTSAKMSNRQYYLLKRAWTYCKEIEKDLD